MLPIASIVSKSPNNFAIFKNAPFGSLEIGLRVQPPAVEDFAQSPIFVFWMDVFCHHLLVIHAKRELKRKSALRDLVGNGLLALGAIVPLVVEKVFKRGMSSARIRMIGKLSKTTFVRS